MKKFITCSFLFLLTTTQALGAYFSQPAIPQINVQVEAENNESEEEAAEEAAEMCEEATRAFENAENELEEARQKYLDVFHLYQNLKDQYIQAKQQYVLTYQNKEEAWQRYLDSTWQEDRSVTRRALESYREAKNEYEIAEIAYQEVNLDFKNFDHESLNALDEQYTEAFNTMLELGAEKNELCN